MTKPTLDSQSDQYFRYIEEPKVFPDGWDLSSLPPKDLPVENEKPEFTTLDGGDNNPDDELKDRVDWQLDPYFDKVAAPSRRDLSAY